MDLPANIWLGAIAGATIFLGLPIARWRAVSDNARGFLALCAAGVILFLLIEVCFQAFQRVEIAALSGTSVVWPSVLLIGGLALGLIGLAWLEDYRRNRRTGSVDALPVALMIAIGIGLHNFAEGLAIGQSFSSGATSLGTMLVVGFALHNATEGFGIAAPLAGHKVSWAQLFGLGLIAGAPTAIGAFIGGIWVNPLLELSFLAVAAGSLVYVTRELLRIRFPGLPSAVGMTAVTLGLFLGFGTELVLDVGQAGASASTATADVAVRFDVGRSEPSRLSLLQGEALEIRNDGTQALVFEGNGLFVGEIAVPPDGMMTVAATGLAGEYRLVDEQGISGIATILLLPGASSDPLLEERNAIGALTVLEGHVRAAKELRDRANRGKGPNPATDLKRAPVHARHPQAELLHGDQPDAQALQKLLRANNLLEPLDQSMTVFVAAAADTNASDAEFDSIYQNTLMAVEAARRAIGGGVYDDREFRESVIRFVLETAAGEYATAAQDGRIRVTAPGVAGQDAYIEYQDARAFIRAARSLMEPFEGAIQPEALQAFDSLEYNIFRTLDPVAPDAPVPPSAVRGIIQLVIR